MSYILRRNFSSLVKLLSRSDRKPQLLLLMPKNRNYINLAQKNRKKFRDKKDSSSNSIAYLQFLGSGARGAPRSLYFFTDFGRYLFNCGEGSQRLAHEHKIKIARLEHIFITYPTWENIGGLPGLILTIQDCGVTDVTIHGPYGIDTIFVAARKFISLNDIHIKMAECNNDAVYDDQTVTINYVVLNKSLPTDNNSHVENSSVAFKGSNKFSRTTFSMAYICKLKPKIGTLNLEACVEKNVPPGPLLGRLKAGIDVTLPDGSVVLAKDVKEPDEPGPVFIILDCPTTEYLDNLLSNKQFMKHQMGTTNEDDIPKYVVHFTPPDIMKDERYQEWMNRFPSKTLHVNSNENNSCLGSVAIHRQQYKLNLLDSTVFPLLNDNSIHKVKIPLSESETYDILKNKFNKTELPLNEKDINITEETGHTLKCLNLRSSEYHDKSKPFVLYMNPQSFIDETMYMDGFPEALNQLKSELNSVSEQIQFERQKRPYPIFTFLGTGSSVPNKNRNTSGILLTLSPDEYMIMDCGEGTFNQFVRFFGIEKTNEILSKLKIIFISHLHADHHMGLIYLLKEKKRVMNKLGRKMEKVFLFAPREIFVWLCNYHQHFESILDCFDLFPNQDYEINNKNVKFDVGQELSLKTLITAYVPHCPQSFGISIVDSYDNKITYSGDCMPSDNLIKAGRNSDLLIHEATFEDELIQEARVKMHSTWSQAIEVGRKMNAKFTMLTHFSQRYAKIPVLNEDIVDNIGIAFDNMQVTFSDFCKYQFYYPVLRNMFSEEQEILGMKTFKRRRLAEIEDI